MGGGGGGGEILHSRTFAGTRWGFGRLSYFGTMMAQIVIASAAPQHFGPFSFFVFEEGRTTPTHKKTPLKYPLFLPVATKAMNVTPLKN